MKLSREGRNQDTEARFMDAGFTPEFQKRNEGIIGEIDRLAAALRAEIQTGNFDPTNAIPSISPAASPRENALMNVSESISARAREEDWKLLREYFKFTIRPLVGQLAPDFYKD